MKGALAHQSRFPQFVRRLCIIMLEDALLHPQLPLVVWLMMTSTHGYHPPMFLLDQLLQITYELATVPVYDPLPHGMDSQPLSQQEVKALLGETPEYLLVKCLLTRAAYGGMGGDVAMMNRYAILWTDRFQEKEKNWHARLLSLYSCGSGPAWRDCLQVELGDIPEEAVDFHCTSIVSFF